VDANEFAVAREDDVGVDAGVDNMSNRPVKAGAHGFWPAGSLFITVPKPLTVGASVKLTSAHPPAARPATDTEARLAAVMLAARPAGAAAIGWARTKPSAAAGEVIP